MKRMCCAGSWFVIRCLAVLTVAFAGVSNGMALPAGTTCEAPPRKVEFCSIDAEGFVVGNFGVEVVSGSDKKSFKSTPAGRLSLAVRPGDRLTLSAAGYDTIRYTVSAACVGAPQVRLMFDAAPGRADGAKPSNAQQDPDGKKMDQFMINLIKKVGMEGKVVLFFTLTPEGKTTYTGVKVLEGDPSMGVKTMDELKKMPASISPTILILGNGREVDMTGEYSGEMTFDPKTPSTTMRGSKLK